MHMDTKYIFQHVQNFMHTYIHDTHKYDMTCSLCSHASGNPLNRVHGDVFSNQNSLAVVDFSVSELFCVPAGLADMDEATYNQDLPNCVPASSVLISLNMYALYSFECICICMYIYVRCNVA